MEQITGKHIVFIGHYGGASNDYDSRNFFFARELVNNGYKVTIINAAYSHRFKKPKIQESIFAEECIDNINFIRIKAPYYVGNGFKRLLNMFVFTKNLFFSVDEIIKKIGKVDSIVMSTPHPFQIFSALKLKKKCNSKLILDLRDIWPLSILELTNVGKWHPLILVMKFTEKLMYQKADLVISPLSNIGAYFSDAGFKNVPFKIIPAGINLENFKRNEVSLQRNSKFIVGYIGGLTDSNAIDVLLDAATILDKSLDIEIRITGDGAQKGRLKEKAKYITNVVFYDGVSKSEAFIHMLQCDLLYRGSPALNLYKYGISPLKLNEYMLTGRPIIHSFSFEESDIVKKIGCGLSVPANDPVKLMLAILEVYGMAEEEREVMGAKGKKYVETYSAYSSITKELEKVL